MRPIEKGQTPVDLSTGQPVRFTRYQEARPHLIERLGEYCSYCEMQVNSSLAVEHVRPKSKNPHLELEWSNLLLACPHCNPTKGDEDVTLGDYIWPDLDDTHLAFRYTQDGRVVAIDGPLKERAERMIRLVGLNKVPKPSESSDMRLRKRRIKYGEAIRYREILKRNNNPDVRELITDLARESGSRSIWVEVFKDDQDMIRRFNQAFVGTCLDCFETVTFAPKSRHVRA
jgi:uncharacterized protein (TIGR02646 family)